MAAPGQGKGAKATLAVACGGTGGHFYPGLSVARAAMAQGWGVTLLLSGRAAEAQARLAAARGVAARVLPSLRAPVGLWGKMAFCFRLAGAVRHHRRELRAMDIGVLLAMGSFNSVPSVLAAASLGIPVVLHEGNARIGKANLFLSRWARRLGIAFDPVNAGRLHCPWALTGMPLRPELRQPLPERAELVARINRLGQASLRDGLPTLLVFGGSQGARTLNQALPTAVRQAAAAGVPFQVIHLAGAASVEAVRQAYAEGAVPALALASWEDMELLYGLADLVVSRAGASTLAELALFGRGAILVPFPYATDRHQDDNAALFVAADAAEQVDDAGCTAEAMAARLGHWLANPEPWRRRGRQASGLAHPDAAERVLELLAGAVR